MAQSGSNSKSGKKSANNLVTASCAAVFAVYVAGYVRTQSAADRFSAQVSQRRAAPPEQAQTVSPITETTQPAPIADVAASSPASKGAQPDRFSPAAAEPISAPAPVAAVDPSPAEAPAPPPPVQAFAVPDSAPVVIPAPEPPAPAAESKVEMAPAPPTPIWKDGTYSGWGYSRHGDIEASVVIEAGRIASATISQCRTRYSCSVIDRLPPQVAQRQSPNVDYVSGATQSADAFYGAVVAALNKAK